MNNSTRSASGKIVQGNYDLLTDILGGSPSTTSLAFRIDGETISSISGDEQEDQTEISEGKNVPKATLNFLFALCPRCVNIPKKKFWM